MDRSTYVSSFDNSENRIGDAVSVFVKSQMTEHHDRTEDHGCRVCNVAASNIRSDVAASLTRRQYKCKPTIPESLWIPTYRLKDGVFSTIVGSRNDTRTAYQGRTNVGQDATVQVWHDQDIKLLRSRHKLHGCIVYNHVSELNTGFFVLLRDIATCLQK